MSPAAGSYSVASLAYLILTVLLAVGWHRNRRAAWLIAAVALSMCWAAATAVFVLLPSWITWSLASVIDGLRLGAFLIFVLLLLYRPQADGSASRQRGFWLWFAVVAAVALAAMGAEQRLVASAGSAEAADAGTLSLLLARSVLGLVIVEQLFRRTQATFRWNVKPLCLALAGVFFYDLVLYADALLFRALDLNIWAGRGLAHALTVPLLGVAAARNREWRFQVSVSRSVLTGSTALLFSGVFLLLMSIAGYYVRFFGGTWGRALEAVFLFGGLLALGLIALSGTFRSKLRVFISKNFFSYRYDYREEWLKFSRAFGAADAGNSASSAHEECIRALADLVESPAGALWLYRADEMQEGVYANVAQRGFGHALRDAAAQHPIAGALPQFLARTGWVIDLSHVRRNADASVYQGLQVPPWLLRSEDAWLIVPLLNAEQLIGFVVLAQPRVAFDLNWEVLDLLKAAGRQAAGYMALLSASDALLEARKFDAFNRMSAFVVHDLKNLVAQLQLMLRNAERHHSNPEFQRDMLKTIEHVVGRMNQLMQQLRSGATPVENARPVDLSAIARRVQMQRFSQRAGLELQLDAAVLALGHEDRLERVAGHLVQNAFDAVSDNPRVVLHVYQRGAEVVLEVSDNGAGMSAEFIRTRLFKPFQSTKTMGMGIGAYESHQYVTGLGGRIAVDSTPGSGTTIRVLLPAAQTANSVNSASSAFTENTVAEQRA